MEGEKHQLVAFCMSPNRGPGPQLKRVPWWGIEPATFLFAGWCPTNWATPARATSCFTRRIRSNTFLLCVGKLRPEFRGIYRPIRVQDLENYLRVTGRAMWVSSIRSKHCSKCEAAFRFPGNFSADFKRKRQREFVSEIEKICIRELGEKKNTGIFPQVPLLAFPCWRESQNQEEGVSLTFKCTPEPIPFLALREDFSQSMV